VLVLLLLLVLEKSRYLSVTLMQQNDARRFGPCFDAPSQQIEHEHDDEHEHDF
jgi:aminopeptidase N